MCLELTQDIQTFCEWCTIASAELVYVFTEPIQMNLFNNTILALNICQGCLNDVIYAEEYALYA